MINQTMAITLLIFWMSWLPAGVLAAGLSLAYNQQRVPFTDAQRWCAVDKSFARLAVVYGWGALIFELTEHGIHGWQWHCLAEGSSR